MKQINSISNKNLKIKLQKVKYAIFDFDGTIYPDLLIVDLARHVFTKHAKKGEEKYTQKLLKLNNLLKKSNKISFQEASLEFIDLLKGESYNEFLEESKVFIDKINDRVKFFISFLKKNNIKCFLVSLTADFVAKEVALELSFENFYSMKYAVFEESSGNIFFSGNYESNVLNPKKFKLKSLNYFNITNVKKEELLFIGNSMDDVELFRKAGIRFVVNPDANLLQQCEFDLIVRDGKKDPWQIIFDSLGLNYEYFDD